MRFSKYFIVLGLFLSLAYSETLTLAQAIADALRTYPAVVAGQDKLSAAQAQEGYAYSFLWPNLALKGTYGDVFNDEYTNISGDKASGLQKIVDPDPIRNTQVGCALSMPVFAAGVWQGAALARIGKDQAAYELEKTKKETIYNVTAVYYQLLLARKNLALIRKQYLATKEDYAMICSRYAANLTPKTDMLRSEIQLRTQEVGLENAKRNLIITEQNFAIYFPSVNAKTIELVSEQIPSQSELLSFDEYKEKMYKSRPEWDILKAAKQINEENYKLAQSEWYPAFYLVGSRNWTRYSMPDLAYEQKNWTLMLQGSWTIFNGFGRVKNVENKKMLNESFEKSMQLTGQTMELELKEIILVIQQSYLQLNNARIIRDLAVENFNQTRARYQAGLDTNITYIDANNTLASAELGFANAEVSVLLSLARLKKIIGIAG